MGKLAGGMKPAMGFNEFCDADVGVDGCGFQLRVAEHRLDVANVAAIAEEPRGKGVAERVTPAGLAGQGAANEPRDMIAEYGRFQAVTVCIEKHRRSTRFRSELRTRFSDVFPDPAQSPFADGNHAVARANPGTAAKENTISTGLNPRRTRGLMRSRWGWIRFVWQTQGSPARIATRSVEGGSCLATLG